MAQTTSRHPGDPTRFHHDNGDIIPTRNIHLPEFSSQVNAYHLNSIMNSIANPSQPSEPPDSPSQSQISWIDNPSTIVPFRPTVPTSEVQEEIPKRRPCCRDLLITIISITCVMFVGVIAAIAILAVIGGVFSQNALVEMRIDDTFQSHMNNISSEETMRYGRQVCNNIYDTIHSKFDNVACTVLSLRNGSVYANIELKINSTTKWTSDSLRRELTPTDSREGFYIFGSLRVYEGSIHVIEVAEEKPSAPSPSAPSASTTPKPSFCQNLLEKHPHCGERLATSNLTKCPPDKPLWYIPTSSTFPDNCDAFIECRSGEEFNKTCENASVEDVAYVGQGKRNPCDRVTSECNYCVRMKELKDSGCL